MPITIERNGIVGLVNLANSLMTDLEANGFDTKYPSAAITPTTTLATLEVTDTVDELAPEQAWRVRIEATDTTVKINLGTVLQLADDGTVTNDGSDINTRDVKDALNKDTDLAIKAIQRQSTSGHLDGADPLLGLTQDATEFPFIHSTIFYPPTGTATVDDAAAPISYRLSVSDHGIAFMAWVEGGDSVGHSFSWFVVQRPVDNQNGAVYVEGKAPVFAVWSGGGGGSAISDTYGSKATTTAKFDDMTITEQRGDIWRMTVREIDINRPTPPTSATLHTEDSSAIINPSKQVAISENNQYIITFPSGLNSNRYVYKHELDMLAFTSADVISQYSDVALTVYGEPAPRKYKAMNANGKFNTGMRILFLTQGSGIPAS